MNILRNKMKVQYFSDIHLELFKNHNDIEKVISKINRCADICVIAGDIGYPFQYSYDFFLKSISKIFKHTIIIHGNHEYYQIIKAQENKSIENIKTKTTEICNTLNNVHFLDNSYIDLPDENNKMYRFIGSTLWSHIYMPQYTVNDKINIDEFTVENNNNWYTKNIEFIEDTIYKSKDIDCVMITHHLPSFNLIDKKYSQGPYQLYNQCFASNSDMLIKSPIKAWIYGHTHMKSNKKINDVICVSNPIGYPGENDESEINFNETISF